MPYHVCAVTVHEVVPAVVRPGRRAAEG